uniref:Uncharacterized protein n=1 Tax=Anguilla anguilla TaxID=7936 RepID=A0A0E9VYT5_ANGAN
MPVPWTGIHCDRKLLPAPAPKEKLFLHNNFVHKKLLLYGSEVEPFSNPDFKNWEIYKTSYIRN